MASGMAAVGVGGQALGGLMQVGSIFGQAAQNDAALESQINALDLQMKEREYRHSQALRSMRRQARQVTSEQKEAYLSGGVKLEGSAMDVIADTMQDFMEAEIAAQREQDFISEQVAVQQAGLSTRRRYLEQNAWISGGMSVLNTGTSMATSMGRM